MLVVAPTGGGKSMCYQQPAIDLPGTALIITPLVALMADQVASLEARGVTATYLASTLDPLQVRQRIDGAVAGAYKLLYVAPERLASQRFVDDVLARLDLSLIAIDEAHCISQWGHDFRPAYLEAVAALPKKSNPTILALTATATPDVVSDITRQLGVGPLRVINTGVHRPNLTYDVRPVANDVDKQRQLLEVLRGVDGAAIVYTGTVRHVEELAQLSEEAGGRSRGWKFDREELHDRT